MPTLIPLLFALVAGQPTQKISVEEMKVIADDSYAVQYYSPRACEDHFAALNNQSTCDDVRGFLADCKMVPVDYNSGQNIDISVIVNCK